MTVMMKRDEEHAAYMIARVLADTRQTPEVLARELFKARALLAHVLDCVSDEHTHETEHDAAACWYCEAYTFVYGEAPGVSETSDVKLCDVCNVGRAVVSFETDAQPSTCATCALVLLERTEPQ